MGLHDFVKCLYPLPPGAPDWAIDDAEHGRTQTKVFGNGQMEMLTIQPDGTLTRARGYYEANKRYKGKRSEEPLVRLRESLRWVEGKPALIDYTGDLVFYTGRMPDIDEDIEIEWVEWRATFCHGKLDTLDLVQPGGDTASTAVEDQTPNDDNPTTQQDAGSIPAASTHAQDS